jgi:acetylglutamate kinase
MPWAAPTAAAQAVLLAAAKARALGGRPVVVKLGGSAIEDPEGTRGALECVAVLQQLGVRLVLVHGGGKAIDRAMTEAGIQPVKVQGRRYTDDATLAIVVRVLKQISGDLADGIRRAGGRAYPFAAHDQFPMDGERLLLPSLDLQPADLGRVGRVTGVHRALFDKLAEPGDGFELPVLASVATDAAGGLLNVNADTAASAVAGAVKAQAALFLSDIPGVLWDRTDPSSRFARLTEFQCKELITSGVIAGGMIPKVEACLDSLDAGAERAVILDGRDPHSLLHWFLGEPAGTEIVR